DSSALSAFSAVMPRVFSVPPCLRGEYGCFGSDDGGVGDHARPVPAKPWITDIRSLRFLRSSVFQRFWGFTRLLVLCARVFHRDLPIFADGDKRHSGIAILIHFSYLETASRLPVKSSNPNAV